MAARARPRARHGSLRREPDDRENRRLRRVDRRALADRHDSPRGRPTTLAVLQARLEDRRPDVRAAIRAGLAAGAYLRIVEPGELAAGDAIEVDAGSLPDHGVTMRMVSDAILLDESLIPQVLEAPGLLPSLREWMTERIV